MLGSTALAVVGAEASSQAPGFNGIFSSVRSSEVS